MASGLPVVSMSRPRLQDGSRELRGRVVRLQGDQRQANPPRPDPGFTGASVAHISQ
jgi:hypothetical protein